MKKVPLYWRRVVVVNQSNDIHDFAIKCIPIESMMFRNELCVLIPSQSSNNY